MDAKLRQFITRAPRLELSHLDSKEMYFALDSERGQKHKTRIVNLSATGLAFVAIAPEAPSVGEKVKVEFTVPKEGKVAWFARVVRIEEYYDSRWWDPSDNFETPPEVLIAVTYEDMPEQHKMSIQSGLDKRFQEIRSERFVATTRSFLFALKNNFWNLVLFGLCVVAGIMMLRWFSMAESFDTDSFFYYLTRGWSL